MENSLEQILAQVPDVNARLARVVGQLIVAVEEKTHQLDQWRLYIQHLEQTIAALKMELNALKTPQAVVDTAPTKDTPTNAKIESKDS